MGGAAEVLCQAFSISSIKVQAFSTSSLRAKHVDHLPDDVKAVALAIEAFHKASLVHDDVEDDDSFRYGRPTIHREYGTPMAINVGDFLIGLGYRLVSGRRDSLGADIHGHLLLRWAGTVTQQSVDDRSRGRDCSSDGVSSEPAREVVGVAWRWLTSGA